MSPGVDLREEDGTLIASIPMAQSALEGLDVDVTTRRLHVTAKGVDVSADLPRAVNGEAAQAKYHKKKSLLTVIMPIAEPESPEKDDDDDDDDDDFSPGEQVEVYGLKGNAALNGIVGVVKGLQGDRVGVVFPAPHGSKAIRPANLRRVSGAAGGLQRPNPIVEQPSSPAPLFVAEQTVRIASDAAAVRRACLSRQLPWYDGKDRWLGEELVVSSYDPRDRTVQLRFAAGPSVAWFPQEVVTPAGGTHADPQPGVSVGGD